MKVRALVVKVYITQYLLNLSEGIAERRLLMNYVNAADRPSTARGRLYQLLLLAKCAINIDLYRVLERSTEFQVQLGLTNFTCRVC